MKIVKDFLFLIVFCIPLLLTAQESLTDFTKSINVKPYEITFLVGMASYEGDMIKFGEGDTDVFTSSGLAFGLNFNYHLSNTLNGGLSYRFGKVKGDDSNASAESGRLARGFSFTNNLNEVSLRLEYVPLGNKPYKLQPYFYGAAGMVFGNPEVNFNEAKQGDAMKSRIANDKADIKKSSVVFPLGFGVKYTINENYTLKAEGALRVGANDYIDGVSISASQAYNDYYGIGGIALGYYFGTKKVATMKEF